MWHGHSAVDECPCGDDHGLRWGRHRKRECGIGSETVSHDHASVPSNHHRGMPRSSAPCALSLHLLLILSAVFLFPSHTAHICHLYSSSFTYWPYLSPVFLFPSHTGHICHMYSLLLHLLLKLSPVFLFPSHTAHMSHLYSSSLHILAILVTCIPLPLHLLLICVICISLPFTYRP